MTKTKTLYVSKGSDLVRFRNSLARFPSKNSKKVWAFSYEGEIDLNHVRRYVKLYCYENSVLYSKIQIYEGEHDDRDDVLIIGTEETTYRIKIH